MRKGRRKVLAGLGLFLIGTAVAAAQPPPGPPPPPPPPPERAGLSPVRLTLEVAWRVPPSPASPAGELAGLDLELSEGRVVDALAWPQASRGEPRRQGRGWRLGNDLAGRVR